MALAVFEQSNGTGHIFPKLLLTSHSYHSQWCLQDHNAILRPTKALSHIKESSKLREESTIWSISGNISNTSLQALGTQMTKKITNLEFLFGCKKSEHKNTFLIRLWTISRKVEPDKVLIKIPGKNCGKQPLKSLKRYLLF